MGLVVVFACVGIGVLVRCAGVLRPALLAGERVHSTCCRGSGGVQQGAAQQRRADGWGHQEEAACAARERMSRARREAEDAITTEHC
ncbi:MAG: hypothetical protein DRN49_07060 [Thaumarchaeota archaeon]|nr:MAG: hypothetical protein DRN49_07060 [Nitrososphaerota archaeon]